MAQGQGNFGNHDEHVKAGQQSTGNPKGAENITPEGRKKGGENSHKNSE